MKARPSLIDVRLVSHSFTTDHEPVWALDTIDLSIKQGEFVSILGPSGCGKSTLVRIIAGLLPHQTGDVVVEGGSANAARESKTFALVPQQPALLPWRTVSANARLLLDINSKGPSQDSRIDDLLDEVGLREFANALPHQLSGGMLQRVALVRAFAMQAPVLLLDEPFASLDELTRADMRDLLVRLWERHQSTAVFVTHSISEAVLLSDRVVVMSGRPGKIIAIAMIDLPRPRRAAMEDSDEFTSTVKQLRTLLRGTAPS